MSDKLVSRKSDETNSAKNVTSSQAGTESEDEDPERGRKCPRCDLSVIVSTALLHA